MTGVVGRGLRKTYGATTALDGVDIDVRRGTVHGLLGPNGAGKSTLLRSLLGLVRLDAGSIDVDGMGTPCRHPDAGVARVARPGAPRRPAAAASVRR